MDGYVLYLFKFSELLLNNAKLYLLKSFQNLTNGIEIIKWKMYFKISVQFSTDVLQQQERDD